MGRTLFNRRTDEVRHEQHLQRFVLVVTNDVFAYFSGMLCGRKFIRRPFIALSPNKTWEGFIGGGIFTIIVGWYLSRFMAQFSWLTCPTNTFSLYPEKLD